MVIRLLTAKKSNLKTKKKLTHKLEKEMKR
jgi:hypothetical protein